MDNDEKAFMMRALELASRGHGLVSPNPLVGAILVKDGRIVGEGYHRYDLLRHAESYAIEMAGEYTLKSTLFCSLEPCCHYGRTPPCTDALIAAGISKAFIAVADPDPRVNGRGIEQLREAGINVETGLCAEEAARVNEIYIKNRNSGIPFFHAVIYGLGDTGEHGDRESWLPSEQFLDMAVRYDAILLSEDDLLNTRIINACQSRKRHRPLVYAIRESDYLRLIESGTIRGLQGDSLFIVAAADGSTLNFEGQFFSIERHINMENVPASKVNSTFILNRFQSEFVTSALLFPGISVFKRGALIDQADKLTVLIASGRLPECLSEGDESSINGRKFIVEKIIFLDSYAEILLYPKLNGLV